MSAETSQDPFTGDLLNDVIPYVERTYRVLPGRDNRAIAGLSMGGVQTLNIGLGNLDRFSHVGVFSSGWFPEVRAAWEANNRALLTDPRTNERLELFWIAAGKEDIANANSKAMNEMFTRYGIRYQWTESEGGHTWINWREYLTHMAPSLFR
jgi:enterochelin esterase family protein